MSCTAISLMSSNLEDLGSCSILCGFAMEHFFTWDELLNGAGLRLWQQHFKLGSTAPSSAPGSSVDLGDVDLGYMDFIWDCLPVVWLMQGLLHPSASWVKAAFGGMVLLSTWIISSPSFVPRIPLTGGCITSSWLHQPSCVGQGLVVADRAGAGGKGASWTSGLALSRACWGVGRLGWGGLSWSKGGRGRGGLGESGLGQSGAKGRWLGWSGAGRGGDGLGGLGQSWAGRGGVSGDVSG